MRALIIGTVAVVAVILTAANPIQAQTPPTAQWTLTAEVTPHTGEITPITGLGEASALVRLTCEPGSVPWPIGTPRRIDIQVSQDTPEPSITVSPTTFYASLTPDDCVDGESVEATVEVSMQFPMGTPAGSVHAFNLVAEEAEAGVRAEAAWTQVAGLYFQHQARLEQTVFKVAPGDDLHLRMAYVNEGNADVDVSFVVGEGTSGGLSLVLPGTARVAAFQETAFNIAGIAPDSDGYINRQDHIVIDVLTTAAGDPDVAGDPVQVSAVVQTQGGGVTDELPAPALPLVALTLVGVALLRRRITP